MKYRIREDGDLEIGPIEGEVDGNEIPAGLMQSGKSYIVEAWETPGDLHTFRVAIDYPSSTGPVGHDGTSSTVPNRCPDEWWDGSSGWSDEGGMVRCERHHQHDGPHRFRAFDGAGYEQIEWAVEKWWTEVDEYAE